MYYTSDEYREEIYADTRMTTARVTLDLAPSALPPTVTASREYAVSQASTELTNGIRTQSYRFVTWEVNRVRLDGRFTFLADTVAARGEVGFVSEAVSTSVGTFEETRTLIGALPPMVISTQIPADVVLTMEWAIPYATNGLSITFNPLEDEYATDFTLFFYNNANALMYSTAVTNHDSVTYRLVQGLTNIKRAVITITKWSAPYRRARIAELDAGVVFEWTDDELIRLSLSEELDPTSGTLVIPELTFTVENSDGLFNPLNAQGVYEQLHLRQRISPFMGLVIGNRTEWIPLGAFYLSDWQSDAGALTATFKARSAADFLDAYRITEPIGGTSQNLKAWLTYALAVCGIWNVEIDDALASITTLGLANPMSYRELIQMALVAGCATLRSSRGGPLVISALRASQSVDVLRLRAAFEEPVIAFDLPVEQVTVAYYTSLDGPAGQVVVSDPAVTTGDALEMLGNTFINTASRAQAVGEWILARKKERKTFAINWRGNPALELYDPMLLENRYLTNLFTYITKQELYYEGYLRVRTEGRSTI